MATFGPARDAAVTNEPARPANFTGARLFIQQRCLGTLAHELGNITSPIVLIADVIDADKPGQRATTAGTLRLLGTSLARATTICRLLRGNADPGSLSPITIPDTSAWWTLCAPFAEDMLPPAATISATIAPVSLPMVQYEALVWATVAIARFAGETRPGLTSLLITGETGAQGATFTLRFTVATPRAPTVASKTRQLLLLASWETRRVGGRVLVADTGASLECRVTLPLPASSRALVVS